MSTATQVAFDLAGLGAAAIAKVQAATTTWTAELQKQVQRNANGTPGVFGPDTLGPNSITGDYKRSINRQVRKTAFGSTGQVGTNKPQGRRLEFGFVGTDSKGRSYDQRPRPHFAPALALVGPKYEAAIALIAIPPTGTRISRTRGIK